MVKVIQHYFFILGRLGTHLVIILIPNRLAHQDMFSEYWLNQNITMKPYSIPRKLTNKK